MQALVTGATGFIGPALVSLLRSKGVAVRCLVRRTADTSTLGPLGVKLVEGDVMRTDSLAAAVQDCDYVFHLAGKTHARSAREFAAVNEQGVRNLAAACADCSGPPCIVLASSLAAAGPGTPPKPRREDDSCRPVSDYGHSKLAGELAAREFADRVPLAIVRPGAVYGPRDRDGLILVRTIARTGWHVAPRWELPLSLIHADDLSSLLWQVADRGDRATSKAGDSRGVYNAAHPVATTMNEMGHFMAAALGKPLRVLPVRRWALATAAVTGEVAVRLGARPGGLGWDKLREACAGGWVASTDKVSRELDWQPRWNHTQGYQQTIDWYRENGWVR